MTSIKKFQGTAKPSFAKALGTPRYAEDFLSGHGITSGKAVEADFPALKPKGTAKSPVPLRPSDHFKETPTPLTLEDFFWTLDSVMIRDLRAGVEHDMIALSAPVLARSKSTEETLAEWERLEQADVGPRAESPTIDCPICHSTFLRAEDVSAHLDSCRGEPRDSRCPICDEIVEDSKLEAHVDACLTEGSASPPETVSPDRLTNLAIDTQTVLRIKEMFPSEFERACCKLPDGSPRVELASSGSEAERQAIIESMLDALINGEYLPQSKATSTSTVPTWLIAAKSPAKLNPMSLLRFKYGTTPGISGSAPEHVARSPEAVLDPSARALLRSLYESCSCRSGRHSYTCNQRAYQEARALAQSLYAERSKELQRAQEVRRSKAVTSGGGIKVAGGACAHYLQTAQAKQQRAEHADAVASYVLFSLRNSGADALPHHEDTVDEVDLHGQHADEAERLLKEVILPRCAHSGRKTLTIITGSGMHSDGKPAMKRRVEEILRQMARDGLHRVKNYTPLDNNAGFRVKFM